MHYIFVDVSFERGKFEVQVTINLNRSNKKRLDKFCCFKINKTKDGLNLYSRLVQIRMIVLHF